jgi:hypothetical protein
MTTDDADYAAPRPMLGPRDQIDPVQFCASQLAILSDRLHAIEDELRSLRLALPGATAAGVESVLRRVTEDSDYGRPHWNAGADHLGARWYERASKWIGATVIRMLAAAVVIAAVTWYVASDGGKR